MLLGVVIALLGISPRPHEVDHAFNLTRSSLETGAMRTASTNLAYLADRFPQRTHLYLLAGRYAFQGDDSQSAIQYLELYAEEDDLPPEDQLILGDAYMQMGDPNTAIQIWQGTLNSNITSKAVYSRLAQFYSDIGDYHDTIDALKTLISLQPDNADYYYQLGLLLTAFDPEASLVYLAQAGELNAIYEPSADKIIRRLNTARLADEPAYINIAAGQTLALLNEWELAAEAFRQAIQIRPDYAEAWAFLGEARQHILSENESPDSEAGLYELKQAISLEPNSIAANIFMGLYWQRQEQYDQAMNYLNSADKLDPDNPILLAEIGNIIAESGDLPAAQEFYEYAIELAPNDPTFWRLLVEFSLRYQIQVRELALPAARRAVILAPRDPKSLDVMGHTLVLLGDELNAERFLRRAIHLDPSYAPAYLHLGLVNLERGDASGAVENLNIAKSLAPNTQIANYAQRLLEYYFP
jgi:tetratricopeptide (TPR) repeat protein